MAIQSVEDKKRTGPIADSSVNSSTFSIADFVGFKGGGRTRVDRSAMVTIMESRNVEGVQAKTKIAGKGLWVEVKIKDSIRKWECMHVHEIYGSIHETLEIP